MAALAKDFQEVGVKNEETVSEDGKILISRETFQRKDCSALIYKYADKAVAVVLKYV